MGFSEHEAIKPTYIIGGLLICLGWYYISKTNPKLEKSFLEFSTKNIIIDNEKILISPFICHGRIYESFFISFKKVKFKKVMWNNIKKIIVLEYKDEGHYKKHNSILIKLKKGKNIYLRRLLMNKQEEEFFRTITTYSNVKIQLNDQLDPPHMGRKNYA